MSIAPVSMEIYQTRIPLRISFKHASAGRDVSEAIIVRILFDDGIVGWGETLPREYVTAETLDSVLENLRNDLWPIVKGNERFGEFVENPVDVPNFFSGKFANAAACAMDIACIRRFFDDAGKPSSQRRYRLRIDTPVSGVIGSSDPVKTAKKLRLMRLYGLKDFKLKLGLGDDIDEENLRVVHRQIRRGIRAGKVTLRVDINGGWTADDTPPKVRDLKRFDVLAVEQPIYCSAGQLLELSEKCCLPLIADESLITEEDAKILLGGNSQKRSPRKSNVWWNIRLSKNGGLSRALKMASLAEENEIPFISGCMVGESGILSAAQRRFLQLSPAPRFVEGNYGKFLLRDDLTKPSIRFGYAGRLSTLKGAGLGIAIDPKKLKKYAKIIDTLE